MDLQIGQALREARARRGIELSEVERVTKIRIKFLRAMEEDRWEALPAPVYTRSFLSTYARFLDLDDKPLVDAYNRWAESEDRAEPIPPQAVRRGVLRPRRPVRPVALLLASLLAAGVVLGLMIAALGGSRHPAVAPSVRQDCDQECLRIAFGKHFQNAPIEGYALYSGFPGCAGDEDDS